ncbi:hypothetical protein IWW34DRAFT_724002 [Fusarium oxysporum f. sp. albedinis]|nr:hypothetical protein IWW34DRAFT_724002 [Fusarium oxysporum f. sp. albedinis]
MAPTSLLALALVLCFKAPCDTISMIMPSIDQSQMDRLHSAQRLLSQGPMTSYAHAYILSLHMYGLRTSINLISNPSTAHFVS